jgi:tetratricopeptide (TPR) repeat protein
MDRNKFGLLIFTLYVVGFILYFIGPYRDYGAGILIAAIVSHIVYTFSPHQRAAVSMLNARRQTELGNIEKAKEYVLKSMKLNKKYSLTGYLLSSSKKSIPLYKKLAESLYKEINNVDDKTYLRYIIASIYYNIGEIQKTIDILSEIDKKDYNIKIVRLFATALLENKNIDKAIEIYKTMEKKEGPFTNEDLAILVGLGLCYAEKKDLDMAEKYYKKAKQSNPAYPELQKLKEKIYLDED